MLSWCKNPGFKGLVSSALGLFLDMRPKFRTLNQIECRAVIRGVVKFVSLEKYAKSGHSWYLWFAPVPMVRAPTTRSQ